MLRVEGLIFSLSIFTMFSLIKLSELHESIRTVSIIIAQLAQSVVLWTLTSSGWGFDPHCG